MTTVKPLTLTEQLIDVVNQYAGEFITLQEYQEQRKVIAGLMRIELDKQKLEG